ncbi:hypothetical protein PMAYCL1PPCAC_04606, partial [Pristionchus mayeri]
QYSDLRSSRKPRRRASRLNGSSQHGGLREPRADLALQYARRSVEPLDYTGIGQGSAITRLVLSVSRLKLISLNSDYCAVYNYYLYLNQTDPDGTLSWLISELLSSEQKGEKVHIISHIPSGDNYCLKGWAHNFYEIVNRFENTIAAQFYGHTHYDHFQLYSDDSNPAGRPTHINFISPSLTTESYTNPAYRIYTIDGGYEGASYTVIDTETYATNLDDANTKDQEPEWFLEYSAKDTFGLPDLSPSSWINLVERLAVDDDLFKKFHRDLKK